MSFLIQHGWGTGTGERDKIRACLQAGLADGVVFGPDTRTPDLLERYIRSLRHDYPDATVLIDPQTYVATIENANYRNLVDYQDRYFQINLNRGSFSPRFIQNFVRRSFEWQLANDVSAIIAPGVRTQGFGSPWAHIAVSLAQESYARKDDEGIQRPVYATIAVSHESFEDFDLVNEFLDELTTVELDGFYLLIFQSGTQYRRAVDRAVLPNVLHFIYSLGEMNDYTVIVGYADLNGYLYRAVGASHFSSGWSHNLRRLTEDRWLGTAGGRAPLPRYTSLPLMNSILVNPDLRRIFEESQIDRVLSDSPFDEVFSGTQPPQSVSWPVFLYHLQYLYACCQLERSVSEVDITQRCRQARSRILAAVQLYSDLIDNHSLEFSVESGPQHLHVWQGALQAFCARVDIRL